MEQTKEQKITPAEKLMQAVKFYLAPTALMSLLWLALGWMKSAGIQWLVLWPLNFITGALNGLQGNTLGGIIGKTLLLVVVNSFFRSVVLRRKREKGSFFKDFRSNALSSCLALIPQYTNLKRLAMSGNIKTAGAGFAGMAGALAIYPFITSDGSLVNSMVCLALFLSVGTQIARQRGLIISLINIMLSKNGKRGISRAFVENIFAGFAVGMALALPIAAVGSVPGAGRLWFVLAKILPALLGLLAAACLLDDVLHIGDKLRSIFSKG